MTLCSTDQIIVEVDTEALRACTGVDDPVDVSDIERERFNLDKPKASGGTARCALACGLLCTHPPHGRPFPPGNMLYLQCISVQLILQ